MTTDLLAMARECGTRHSEHIIEFSSIDQLAAFKRAILADAAKGVEPVGFAETADLISLTKANGQSVWCDGPRMWAPYCDAALQARVEELEALLEGAVGYVHGGPCGECEKDARELSDRIHDALAARSKP